MGFTLSPIAVLKLQGIAKYASVVICGLQIVFDTYTRWQITWVQSAIFLAACFSGTETAVRQYK